MFEIFIPHPEKKRALIVVDMQAGFLPDRTRWIIPNVQKIIQDGGYRLFVEAVFHADLGSLWDRQTHWTFPPQPTIPDIAAALAGKPLVHVEKTVQSAFSGDKDLVSLFRQQRIEEVHVAGVDANDCVLATALDSFKFGFFTYVLEECVASSNGDHLRDAALTILRNIDLTNHSEFLSR